MLTNTHKRFPADYQQLSAILALADSDISPSELHGIACGGICALPVVGSTAGLMTLLQLEDTHSPLVDALADLIAHSSVLLKAGDPEFALLLPPESAPLAERAQGLADWCRGFVMAVLQGPYTEPAKLPGELQEIVEDLLAIAQAQSSGDDPRGEDWALAELEEYVRTGVQIVYEEIYAKHPVQDPTAGP